MTCKDNCAHFEVCSKFSKAEGANWEYYQYANLAEKCECFKNTALCKTIPCEVGTNIFTIIEDDDSSFVDAGKVETISFQKDGTWIWVRYNSGLTYWYEEGSDDFGKTVFFSKEKAEKVLGDMNVKREQR